MNLKIKVIALLFFIVLLTACVEKPWVKPYERGYLAEPMMNFSRDPIYTQYIGHVYATREGAQGASISSGGGCGCN